MYSGNEVVGNSDRFKRGQKMLKYTFFSVFELSFSDVLMFEIAIFVVLNIIYLLFFNKY